MQNTRSYLNGNVYCDWWYLDIIIWHFPLLWQVCDIISTWRQSDLKIQHSFITECTEDTQWHPHEPGTCTSVSPRAVYMRSSGLASGTWWCVPAIKRYSRHRTGDWCTLQVSVMRTCDQTVTKHGVSFRLTPEKLTLNI